MPNLITLSANPAAVAPQFYCGKTDITASVKDSTGRPIAGVKVNLSTPVSDALLEIPTDVTDSLGEIKATLKYSRPKSSAQSSVGVVPVLAATADSSCTLLVNFYDPRLRPVRILNSQTNIQTGKTDISPLAINIGLQALIYFPDTIVDGDKLVFYWGRHSTKKTYTPGEHIWVVDFPQTFNPDEVFVSGEYLVWYSIESAGGEVIGAQPLNAVIGDTPFAVLAD